VLKRDGLFPGIRGQIAGFPGVVYRITLPVFWGNRKPTLSCRPHQKVGGVLTQSTEALVLPGLLQRCVCMLEK
jgi:hypothetical protein